MIREISADMVVTIDPLINRFREKSAEAGYETVREYSMYTWVNDRE